MRPDPETSNAFIYCLGVAAERFQIEVVGFGMMSNHAHVVVCDPAGELPNFLQLFHRLFACHQNALRGRVEAFWVANRPTSVVELLDADVIVEKLVYAITNPVKDLLVDKLEHWPGPNALAAIISGDGLRAQRPKRFFSSKALLPTNIHLKLYRPQVFEDLSNQEFAARVASRVNEVTEQIRRTRIADGRRVVGKAAILKQHWNHAPESEAPTRNLSPHFASTRPDQRRKAIHRYREWLEAYRCTRSEWIAGAREAVFPVGVWWLRRFAGVACVDLEPGG